MVTSDREGRANEILRLRTMRDRALSLREMGEWCVEIEEALGGRPPTRERDTAPPTSVSGAEPERLAPTKR